MHAIHCYKFDGVYTDGRSLYTRNLAPGYNVYGERLILQDDTEYRIWDLRRSKLAAMLWKGSKIFMFQPRSKVLYLGAATGTTASHISDIVTDGCIYCVEISYRPFRNLLFLSERRKNIFPILSDANKPESYAHLVGTVDIIYQDIAQREQSSIFIKNIIKFLSDSGIGIIMVKARSINVAIKPKKIFETVEQELKTAGLNVLERISLEPFEKDHIAIAIRK